MANAGSFGMPKRDHRLWARSFYGLQKDTVQSPRVVSNRLVNHSSSKHYDRCVCAKQSVGLKWFLSDLLHKSAPNKVLRAPEAPQEPPEDSYSSPDPPDGAPGSLGSSRPGPVFRGSKNGPWTDPKRPPENPPGPLKDPQGFPKQAPTPPR